MYNYDLSLDNAAVDMWYGEYSAYNFDHPTFSSNTGHFTQMVWKNSAQLGVGVAYSKTKHVFYIVANYNPPGNIQKAFKDNVYDK